MDFLSCTVMLAGVDAATAVKFHDALTRRGLNVLRVADGRTVFAGFDEELPDLLVVPERLPDMSAAQLCHHLRLNTATRGIPVLVLVEDPDAARERGVLERGADVCYCMPAAPAFLPFRVCTRL